MGSDSESFEHKYPCVYIFSPHGTKVNPEIQMWVVSCPSFDLVLAKVLRGSIEASFWSFFLHTPHTALTQCSAVAGRRTRVKLGLCTFLLAPSSWLGLTARIFSACWCWGFWNFSTSPSWHWQLQMIQLAARVLRRQIFWGSESRRAIYRGYYIMQGSPVTILFRPREDSCQCQPFVHRLKVPFIPISY